MTNFRAATTLKNTAAAVEHILHTQSRYLASTQSRVKAECYSCVIACAVPQSINHRSQALELACS